MRVIPSHSSPESSSGFKRESSTLIVLNPEVTMKVIELIIVIFTWPLIILGRVLNTPE